MMRIDIVRCTSCSKMYILDLENLKKHTFCFACKSAVEQYALGEYINLTEQDRYDLVKYGYLYITKQRKLYYGL